MPILTGTLANFEQSAESIVAFVENVAGKVLSFEGHERRFGGRLRHRFFKFRADAAQPILHLRGGASSDLRQQTKRVGAKFHKRFLRRDSSSRVRVVQLTYKLTNLGLQRVRVARFALSHKNTGRKEEREIHEKSLQVVC